MKIILASSSPRRRELLFQLTDAFDILAPDVKEETTGEPEFVARVNAERKGQWVDAECDFLIACDTLVALNGKIYGKPVNAQAAVEMIRELQGKQHVVISGVYVRSKTEKRVFSVQSTVSIKSLDERQIEEYVRTYRPYDKAGAYGIQDGVVVSRYEGDYDNIVGLPVQKLLQTMKEMGYEQSKSDI